MGDTITLLQYYWLSESHPLLAYYFISSARSLVRSNIGCDTASLCNIPVISTTGILWDGYQEPLLDRLFDSCLLVI